MLYCVMARPNSGYAEMMIEAFDTLDAANARMGDLEARYPGWRFRVATHQAEAAQ